MRYSTLLLVLVFTTYSFSQSSSEAMGASGGCQDGKASAHSKSMTAYNSIMNNSSISQAYKSAYRNAFYDCRETESAKSKNSWKFAKSSSVYGERKDIIRWGPLKKDEAYRGNNEKEYKSFYEKFYEQFYKSKREK